MRMADYADDDGQWLVAPRQRKARVVHKCEDCGSPIDPGEVYWYGKWLYDGRISTFKTCARCVVSARWLNVVCGGHLWGYDSISQDLREHWDNEPEYMTLGLGRLIAARENRWRRKDGALWPVETIAGWVDDAIATLRRRGIQLSEAAA